MTDDVAGLSYQAQVRQLRRLAEAALGAYGLEGASLRLIAHRENSTFRVDAPPGASDAGRGKPYARGRYLLRVHRQGEALGPAVASELAWLLALHEDTGLPVPLPLPTVEGEWVVRVTTPELPGGRICSLLCWLDGRFYSNRPRPSHLTALGRLMARLHEHAIAWEQPPGFTRRHHDWPGLFGDGRGLKRFHLPAAELWALIPAPYRELFEGLADQTRAAMEELGQDEDAFGLIHADLIPENVLFSGSEARPIDFDDCGLGYWLWDMAVTLVDCPKGPDFPPLRDALLEGYSQLRTLPERQLDYLELFMAARKLSLVLWSTDLAQRNPAYQEGARAGLDWAAEHARRLLD